MPATIYRGRVRLILHAAGCGLAAVLCGAVAVQTGEDAGAAIALWFAAGIFVALALRIPRTRVEADGNGITLHSITRRAFFSWDSVALIAVFDTPIQGGLLPVYAPSLSLIDGGSVELTPAGCYRRAMAVTYGVLLDAQRRNQLEAAYGARDTDFAAWASAVELDPHETTGGRNEAIQ